MSGAPPESDFRPRSDCDTRVRDVVIVGNGPPRAGYADRIDAADFVVRFNACTFMGHGAGGRLDALSLISGRHQAARYLQPTSKADRSSRERVLRLGSVIGELLFPMPNDRPADVHRRRAAIDELRQAFGWLDRVHTELIWTRTEDLELYGSEGRPPRCQPSSGMVVVRKLLDLPRFLDAKLTLACFSWVGWSGHDWAAEEALCRRMAADGRLQILDSPRVSRSRFLRWIPGWRH
jgi:hypothetical protein